MQLKPACSLFLIVTSCVMGPEPTSPEKQLPDAIRGGSVSGESFGEKSWRQVFRDPTLRSLIETAIRQNPDLVAATYRIEQARAQAIGARSQWYPQLTGRAGYTENYASQNGTLLPAGADRSSESYDLTGFLTWEIDLWGGIRRNNQAARARFLAAVHQRDAVRTSLVASVAAAYIELGNLDERLAIAQRTAESRQASLDLVTARRDGGVSSDLELAQADSLLQEARTAIPITEQAIVSKENQIRFLLGDYPSAVARGGGMESLIRHLRIDSGLPSALLARRPDVAAADQSFQAAVADIGVAESLRLPNLSLTGSGGMLSSKLSNLLENPSATFSIGPQLTGPVFDAGLRKARARAARAAAMVALAEHDRAAKLAFREAADGINAYHKTAEIASNQARLVQSLGDVARVATERFEGGASSYLEVLDAQRTLFSAELALADVRRDHLLAVVQTYRALGGGWK